MHPVAGRATTGETPVELELYVVDGRLHLLGLVPYAWPDPDFSSFTDPDAFSVYASLEGEYRLMATGTLPTFETQFSAKEQRLEADAVDLKRLH